MHAVRVLACCLLLLAVSSCNRQSDNKHGSHSAAVKEEGLMPEKDNLPKEVIVRQRTSGGLLPVEREWLFYSDGKIRHPNGEITTLEENIVDKLLSPGRISVLADVAPDYPPPAGSTDFVTIELTIRSHEGIRKITAADSNDLVPAELWDFWNKLQDAAKRSLAKSSDK